MSYYLEKDSNIYREMEAGSLDFTRYLSLLYVILKTGDFKMDLGWAQSRLPFLQTLARTQEQLIMQSIKTDSIDTESTDS